MGIMSRLVDFALMRDLPANQPPERRDALGASVAVSQIGRPQWPSVNLRYDTDQVYSRLATVYACIAARAHAAGTAPLRVYQDTGGGQREEDQTHPLRTLLANPNPFISEAEFWSQIVVSADVTGFCVIEKERSFSGRVIGLWPLRSDWLRVIPREQAAPDWEYRVPRREPVTISAADVLVYTTGLHPDHPATGFSPLRVLFRETAIDNAMTDFLKAFFDRGGVPQYGLIPADDVGQLTPAEADALRERWQQRFGGASGMAEIAVLTSIKDVKRIGFDFDEMAYTDLRDLTELHICSVFGVPPGLIGVRAGLDRNTFSNAETMRRSFYEDTITQLWTRLDGAFTRGLLPEFEDRPGYSVEFDTSNVPALQTDVTPTWSRAGAAVTQGWATVNDARREAGLPPVQGGDVFLRSLVSVEVPATEERSVWRPTHVREIIPAALPSGGETFHRLPAEQRARIGAANKATIARLGHAAAKPLARFFQAQGERLIPLILSSAERQRRDVADIDWAEEERRLREVVSAVHVAAGETAFQAVSRQLSVSLDFDLANPLIRAVMHELAGRVVDISDTTRTDIARVVTEALDEGASIPQLRDRLRGLFEETYKGRAETIARTESMMAYGAASVEGYRQSGVVSRVEILDNPDHTDPYPGAADGLTCAQRDGIIVALDAAMLHIGSDHPNGSAVALPVLDTPLGEDES